MRLQSLLILGGLIALGMYADRRPARGPSSLDGRRDVADPRSPAATRGPDQVWARPARREPAPGFRERWDKVDQASYESFPASDAPGY